MSENCDNSEMDDERTIAHSSIHLTLDNRKLLEPGGCICDKPQLYIEFNDLSYWVCTKKEKQKEILRNISGHFRPGRLTGIIGPSGAGKTSLLSIISGQRLSNLKGSITVNGAERNGEVFRKQACYVPQEFALLPLLTTKETLYIASCLKLGWPHTSASREFIVSEIANRLGLMDCLDTPAGNLSNGEKKRLSIGVELIINPPVMLLDEPTSGLDSASSNQVISLLRTMAQAGRTVVCAVHQPSSQLIAQFDDVIVLNQGKILYCGPREEMYDTFKNAGYICPQFYNIAEYVLEVVTEQRGGDLQQLHKSSKEKYASIRLQYRYSIRAKNDGNTTRSLTEYPEEDEEGIARPGRYSISRCKQQQILLSRAIICIQRDNTMTKLRLAAHLAVAFLLGAVFQNFGNDASKVQSNISCLFFFLLFLFFANAMPAVQMFPIEAAVFFREHLNNWYSLQSYYVAKIVSDLPLQILCPSCFLIIAYWMTGQPMEAYKIWQVWLVCTLLTILAQSFGIAAGAAFNTHAGTFLVPALNIPMFLFAGFFLKLKEVPVYLQPLCTVSFFRYAFEGILQAIYEDNRPTLKSSVNCSSESPESILSQYINESSTQFYTIILSLSCWILCLHVSIYTVLRWKLYNATK